MKEVSNRPPPPPPEKNTLKKLCLIRVKGCFNKRDCNFDDVSKIGYSTPF